MNDFLQAVKACLRKYADFSGRAARPEFWWFLLFQVVVTIAAAFAHGLLHMAVLAGLFLPSVAAGVRRMHDTGRSGWLLLLVLVPFVGGLIVLWLLAQPGQPGQNGYGAAVASGGRAGS